MVVANARVEGDTLQTCRPQRVGFSVRPRHKRQTALSPDNRRDAFHIGGDLSGGPVRSARYRAGGHTDNKMSFEILNLQVL